MRSGIASASPRCRSRGSCAGRFASCSRPCGGRGPWIRSRTAHRTVASSVYRARRGTMSMLDVTTERLEGQTRVVLVGELDIASAETLERELETLEADSPGTLVLDLRRVEFIDSTGLRAVIAADARARSAGRRFVIV